MMINREDYLKIVKLYAEEKNLNRLVYRIIKHENENLSFQQIANRVVKIAFDKKEIEKLDADLEQQKREFRLNTIETLKSQGCTIIEVDGYSISYEKSGKRYCMTTLSYENELSEKKHNEYDKRYLKPIENAINVILSHKWITFYDDTSYYTSPYSGKSKIRSNVRRYKNAR